MANNQGISASEAIAILDGMSADGDIEDNHRRADRMLCEVLKTIGYAALAEAFERASKRSNFFYS